MSPDLPGNPDLDHLRKQAKQLLRAARAREREALDRVRGVPRLAGLDDARLAAQVQLADAQHAIAREYRHESWPALKHAIEAAAPIERQAEMLLRVRAQRRRGTRPPAARAAAGARAVQRLRGVLRGQCRRDRVAAPARSGARDDAARAVRLGATALPVRVASSAKARRPRRGACAAPRCCSTRGRSPNSHMFIESEGRRDPIAALYFACVANHVGVVRLLLERGANPNDGESVYHAAELNHRECLEALLAHGARIGAKHEHWNNTPLFFLAGYRDHNARVVTARAGMRWLLEHGADPNVPSYEARETPLHLWARNDTAIAAIDMLLDHGADPNLPRADGRTPYVLAVRGGHEAIAARLRERGAPADAPTPLDALIGACMRGDRADSARAAGRARRARSIRGATKRANWSRRRRSKVAAEALRLLAEFGCDVDSGATRLDAAPRSRVARAPRRGRRTARARRADRRAGSEAIRRRRSAGRCTAPRTAAATTRATRRW